VITEVFSTIDECLSDKTSRQALQWLRNNDSL